MLSLNFLRHTAWISSLLAVAFIYLTPTLLGQIPLCYPLFEECATISYYSTFSPGLYLALPFYTILVFTTFLLWRGLFQIHSTAPHIKTLNVILLYILIGGLSAVLTFSKLDDKIILAVHTLGALALFLLGMALQMYVSFSKNFGQSTILERIISVAFIVLFIVILYYELILKDSVHNILEWWLWFLLTLWYLVSNKRWNGSWNCTNNT